MFVNGSARNKQSQQRNFHRCFLPRFGPFGQTVSKENNFKNQPIRSKNRLWRPCLLVDRDGMSNIDRGPSIYASYQVSGKTLICKSAVMMLRCLLLLFVSCVLAGIVHYFRKLLIPIWLYFIILSNVILCINRLYIFFAASTIVYLFIIFLACFTN